MDKTHIIIAKKEAKIANSRAIMALRPCSDEAKSAVPMAETEKNTRDGFSMIYPTNPSIFYLPGEAFAKGGKRVAWGDIRLFCSLQDITFRQLSS